MFLSIYKSVPPGSQESHSSHCAAMWFFATALLQTKQGNYTTTRLCYVKSYKPRANETYNTYIMLIINK